MRKLESIIFAVIVLVVSYCILGTEWHEPKSIVNNALPFPANVRMSFTFKKFLEINEYAEAIRDLKYKYPNQFTYRTYTNTYTDKLPLYWVEVGSPDKPAIVITSVMHAKNEWQGAHVVLNFIKKLLDPSDNQNAFNNKLLENFKIVAVPIVNTWGYFASQDGKHHNGHKAYVPRIEEANWHDMSNYKVYSGVNLNRNFDQNWDIYPSLPWSVRSFWNGRDYGTANYFMMPYYIDQNNNYIYDPENKIPNHALMPDLEIYDYKGSMPFSEPETRLIRDLFSANHVVGFIDIHLMNPWDANNASYTSSKVDRSSIIKLVDEGLQLVSSRNTNIKHNLKKTKHYIIEEYDNNAPMSLNWAQNKKRVKSFGWETGTMLPEEIWTDCYMEMIYRGTFWLQVQ